MQGAEGHGCSRLYTAERLYIAVQVFCMVERTIIIGNDLFGHGRKIMARQ
jgi:hypothetical protein